MKPRQGQIISVLKACRNQVATSPPAAVAATSLVGHQELLNLKPPQFHVPQPASGDTAALKITPTPTSFMAHSASSTSTHLDHHQAININNPIIYSPIGFGSPCLDLFFNYPVDADEMTLASADEYHEQLKQLLPLAWSYNPLTTLKIICNLLDVCTSTGKFDEEVFYTAAIWLHHNHPKTLACNLLSIAGWFTTAYFPVLVKILYWVVHGRAPVGRDKRLTLQYGNRVNKVMDGKSKEKSSALLRRRKMIIMAKKTAERYDQDPDFQFVHDRVADIFAECLKYDIDKLQQQQQHYYNDNRGCLEITRGAFFCPSIDSSMARPTDLLCESIWRKVFPEGGDLCCFERLNREVLVPLRNVLESAESELEPFVVDKYMEEVKAAGESKIKPDAVLPHHLIHYIMKGVDGGDWGLVAAAELQWKRMVEEIYLKQGKLNNCLALCSAGCLFGPPSSPYRVPAAMGLLLSQLSEDPWKGKVMFYSINPQIHLIQGDDLKSKCEFMKRMKDNLGWQGFTMDLRKVFDLILEVAMNGNLKPEQMIKRVFLFNSFSSPDIMIRWETDYYEEIQSKFEEKGYGDVVPQLVCWNLCKKTEAPRCTKPGLMELSNFSDNFLKSFLDNDGEIGPDHVMEAAISGQGYQSLVVVD